MRHSRNLWREVLPVSFFRSVEMQDSLASSETMSTMVCNQLESVLYGVLMISHDAQVATPYVNHIATMTGGVGFEDLSRFYKVCD